MHILGEEVASGGKKVEIYQPDVKQVKSYSASDETVSWLHDECCGQIYLAQHLPQRSILWESAYPQTCGTFTIYYAKGMSRMLVYVNGEALFFLQANQSRSVSIPRFRKLEVSREVSTENSPSIGKYCISVHYMESYITDHEEE